MSRQNEIVKSFAKRLLLLIILAPVSFFLIKGIYAWGPPQTQESSSQERKIKTRDFKDMPVALVEVRNQQSETWYEDLEIEVKNISTKPIYFVRAYLLFPDEKFSWGESGIRLTWGDSDKLDSRNYADLNAEPVEPGKNFVLTIPEMFRKGLKTKQRVRPTITKNLVLEFTKIYFGDGTGFEGPQLRDFRGNDPPKLDKNHHSSRLKEKEPTHSSASTMEPICGGGNCFQYWLADSCATPCLRKGTVALSRY